MGRIISTQRMIFYKIGIRNFLGFENLGVKLKTHISKIKQLRQCGKSQFISKHSFGASSCGAPKNRVGKVGVEPTRSIEHMILSHACLPIPALPQAGKIIRYCYQSVNKPGRLQAAHF